MKLKNLFFGIMAFALILSTSSFAANSYDRTCTVEVEDANLASLDLEGRMAFEAFSMTSCSDCNVSIGSLGATQLNPCKYGMGVTSSSVHSPCYINFYRWFVIGPNGNWYSIDTSGPFHLADMAGWGSGNVTIYVRAVAAYPENPDVICFSNISTWSTTLSAC